MAADPVTRAPRSLEVEAGYVNGSAGPLTDMWWWDLHEQVPDLKWPLSLTVFERMPREDSRVWSLLSAIKLPVRRTAWRIDPNGAPRRVVKFVANEFGLPIVGDDKQRPKRPRQKGRFSWAEHLNEALSCLRYGHSVFEQVYALGDDGLLHLHKLAPRPQSTIARFNVARDGGLESIWQEPPAGWPLPPPRQRADGSTFPGGYVEITIDRLVVYRHEPEPGVWIGTSLLRPSYKHWVLKDEFLRLEAATARRNGMGLPVAWAPPGPDSEDPAKLAKYGTMAQKARAGMNAGIGLPAEAKFELKGVQGNLPDMRLAIEYHDKQIALAGLAHFLNLDRGGSYALASVQADTFVQSVQTFADTIADTTTEHVIEDLVDLNFGPDVAAPRIVSDEIGSRQDATAAALQMLVAAGLLTPDESLRAFIRQQLGAPPEEPKSDDDEGSASRSQPGQPEQELDAPTVPDGGNQQRRPARRGNATPVTDQGELF